MQSYKTSLDFLLSHIIWFMFCCVLLVDTLTGYFLLNETNAVYSQLFKFCLLLLLILKNKSLYVFLLLFIFGIYITFFIVYIALLKAIVLQDTLLWLNKFILFILVFFFVKNEIISNGKNTVLKIKWVFFVNFIVILLNLLIAPLFGLGFVLYSGVESSKGFFCAGNEVGVTLIVIFSYLYFSYRQNKIVSIVLLIIATILVLSFPTKVAIIGLFFAVVFVSNKKKMIRIILSVKILFMMILFLFITSFYFINSGLFDKFQYFFLQNGWWFLLSGRNFYLLEKIDIFEKSSLVQQMFGIGEHVTVEMDFFDILFNFGYIGLLLFCCVYWYFFQEVKKRLRNSQNLYVLYVYRLMLLLWVIAFLAGHVVFSAMAGVFIGIVFALMYYDFAYE